MEIDNIPSVLRGAWHGIEFVATPAFWFSCLVAFTGLLLLGFMVEVQLRNTRKFLSKSRTSESSANLVASQRNDRAKNMERGQLVDFMDRIQICTVMNEMWASRRLVTIRDDETLEKALELFRHYNIMSMPVVESSTSRVLGLVDVLDVLRHLSDTLTKPGSMSDHKWGFMLKDINGLINPAVSERQHILISSQAKLADCLPLLTKGQHRLIVVDTDINQPSPLQLPLQEGSVLGLLTQMDVVRFLAKNIMWFSDIFERTLEELNVANGEREVVIVTPETQAYEAFNRINQAKVHACAIVDERGRLIGNLSATDIKGINRRNFDLLERSVSEFLARAKQRKWFHVPICVHPYDKMKEVVLKFMATSVHRVYVYSIHGRPIGVVSLTDVLTVLNNQLNLCKASITPAH